MFIDQPTARLYAAIDNAVIVDEITHYANFEAGGTEYTIRCYQDVDTEALFYVKFITQIRRTKDGTEGRVEGIAQFADIDAVKDWLHGAEDAKSEVAFESYQTRSGYGYASHAFGGVTYTEEGRAVFNKPEGWWTYTITPGKLDWSELA